MKKVLVPFLFLLAIVGYTACQKENSRDAVSVEAAKTAGIRKGEPVNFRVENFTGKTTNWAVTPSQHVQLTSNGNQATILFGRAGSYAVTAVTGTTTARVTVTVSDSCYCDSTINDSCRYVCPPDTTRPDTCTNGFCLRDTTLALTGDSIHITPSRIDSNGVSGLRIAAITRKLYPCVNHTLATSLSNVSVNYAFFFAGVKIPGTCVPGFSRAQSVTVIYPIQDGTHAFSVVLNNTIYSGSFTKTGNQYVFNWPYTSVVTISPQTIN